jgi:23S rRNA (uridine2552-2'-O)-methyltransferase
MSRGRGKKGPGAPTSGRGKLKERVKTARGRKLSSTRWLQRQLNDPYVEAARAEGYRSRAAFKLIELDEKFGFLKKGRKVLDLGAAPGGWCQVAVAKCGEGNVLGIDLQEIEPIPGAGLMVLDIMDEDAPDRIKEALGGPVDIVMSDMAASSTGHRQTDHLRIIALCEAALDLAYDVLAPGGDFIAKVLRGGTEGELLKQMKAHFETVRHAKPPASRQDSAEMYVVAQGFKPFDREDPREY